MAKYGLQTIVCGFALCATVTAMAEEDEVPDGEFLEYLGLWEESDEEWLLLTDEAVAGNEERSDPVPKGEESTETEDES